MYHSIDFEPENDLKISKDKFKKQMYYLKENNYTTLTLDEVYNFIVNNEPIPEKSVVITFDDGYEDNYRNAYPILKELNFHGVIYIVTDTINKDENCLTLEQIKELKLNGIDIQSHTEKHEDLSELTYEEQINTLENSKKCLENILDKEINYIAYPYGKWNKYTVKAVKEAGYLMGFTTGGRWSGKDDGIYTLDRVYIGDSMDMNEFIERVNNCNYIQK